MTSKLVVNTIEADTGISSVSFASSISLSSTSVFHLGDAGFNIGADTNINRPGNGVIGFNINSSEKLRIDSNGRLLLGTITEGHPAADDFTIANTANAADMGITLRSADNGQGAIYFSDGTSGADEYRGIINYNHTDNFFSFFTDASEKFRIGSSGQIGLSGANYGDAGQVLTSQGTSSAPTWATPSSGLSNVQQWRLTVSGNCSSGSDNILPTDAGTWEAADTVSPGSLGTGMTYASNGIFVFPSTGIWKIDFHGFWGISASDSDAILKSRIYCTTNNSSYSVASQQINSIKSDAQYTYQGWYVTHIFDVTNTSTHKVRFVLNPSGGNTYYKARSDWTETGALFMRLGDT